MKKYRVHGYVQAGQHRWKLVEKVVEIKDVIGERGIRDAATGAWLMELELDGRIAGSPYQTGYQNIEQALTEFAEKVKAMLREYSDTESWLDENSGDGLMSVWQFRDWVLKENGKIYEILQEYLNSLKNQNQGD